MHQLEKVLCVAADRKDYTPPATAPHLFRGRDIVYILIPNWGLWHPSCFVKPAVWLISLRCGFTCCMCENPQSFPHFLTVIILIFLHAGLSQHSACWVFTWISFQGVHCLWSQATFTKVLKWSTKNYSFHYVYTHNHCNILFQFAVNFYGLTFVLCFISLLFYILLCRHLTYSDQSYLACRQGQMWWVLLAVSI